MIDFKLIKNCPNECNAEGYLCWVCGETLSLVDVEPPLRTYAALYEEATKRADERGEKYRWAIEAVVNEELQRARAREDELTDKNLELARLVTRIAFLGGVPDSVRDTVQRGLISIGLCEKVEDALTDRIQELEERVAEQERLSQQITREYDIP